MSIWANPMLTVPKLSDMSGKKEQWLRDHLKGEDPIPHSKDGATPLILYSDYVEWYQRRYSPASDMYGENAGKR